MGLSFLSPLGALLAVAAVVPIAAYALLEVRSRRLRRTLGLPPPTRTFRATLLGALCLLPALLALAATQPVLDLKRQRSARTDAEAMFVIDTSRSMMASRGPHGAMRIDRARRLMLELRSRMPDIPVGIASMTDRTLPHLLPTLDEQTFATIDKRVVGIEKPPPGQGEMVRVTTLGALANVATRNFFSPSAQHRLLVVFSDDESDPFAQASVVHEFLRPPAIKTIFVRFWDPRERIYTEANLPEAGYQPDPTSAGIAARLASAVGGKAFSEHRFEQILHAAQADLGTGPHVRQPVKVTKVELAPYVSLAALLPLSLLLWRRNL
ncbi:MAG TPA: vWA domain-containing protein [Gaiellaceae bacterium]